MMRHDGEEERLDAWTGMPADFADEVDEVLVLPSTPVPKKTSRWDVRDLFWKYVASGNANTPSGVLAVLATDERAQIRRRVAENSNTNADTLALLADDIAASVRTAVARNLHTPVFILRKLSHDPSADVRYAIASNPEMPDAILLSLFMDPDPFVADRASQTLAA